MKICIVHGNASASPSAPGPSLEVPMFLSLSSPLLLQPPERWVGKRWGLEARIQAKKSRAGTLNISSFPFVLEAPCRGLACLLNLGSHPTQRGQRFTRPRRWKFRVLVVLSTLLAEAQWDGLPLGSAGWCGQVPSAVRQTTHSCPEPPKHRLSRSHGAKCPQLPASSPQCLWPQTTVGPQTHACLARPSRWE